MTYLREDQFLIHAGVNGVSIPSVHSWQSKEGGDVQSDAVVTHPGGMLGAITLGGPNKRSDVTVKRIFQDTDMPFVRPLEQACGNSRGWVSWTPLDADKNPVANSTMTLNGVLKEVQSPQGNANATGPANLGLVFSVDE
jgi:hypothetical protein